MIHRPALPAASALVLAFALLLALGIVSSSSAATSGAGGKSDGDIIPGRYIVVLRGGVNAQYDADNIEREDGIVADKVYGHAIKGFAARLSPDQVRKLKSDSRVDSIEPDRIITAFPQTPPTGVRRMATGQNASAAIDGVDANGGLGLDTDIAIIDTGIQPDHPDLRVAGGASFVWNGSTCAGGSYADDNGHGTHVAGIAAARDNGTGVVGVAPGARLWAVKVLDSSGSGAYSCVIAGVDWVTANAATIKVANMSMGGGSSPALCNAIANSVAAGVIYTVAAGNSGADASGTSPANCSSVIAVSAIADYNGLPGGGYSGSDCYGYNPPYYGPDDTFASFSNYGSVVDIAAPGVCITSTFLGGGYASLSGTSMASPHVAGAAALLRLAGYSGSADGPTVVSAMTAAGYTTPQNGPCGFTGDPDAFHEPLVWLGASCGTTPTPSATPTATPNATPTSAPTASPTPTPTPTGSPTPTPTPTRSPTPTPTPTGSPTPAPASTESPTPTTTEIVSPTPIPTPTASPTPTSAPTASPMPTCPNGVVPPWRVAADDPDCDGFTSSREAFLGTDPSRGCAATAAPNDEPPPDAWPVDFNNDQKVNGQDFLMFTPFYGRIASDSRYNARFDLNADGKVNGNDFLIFAPFFGKSCAP